MLLKIARMPLSCLYLWERRQTPTGRQDDARDRVKLRRIKARALFPRFPGVPVLDVRGKLQVAQRPPRTTTNHLTVSTLVIMMHKIGFGAR